MVVKKYGMVFTDDSIMADQDGNLFTIFEIEKGVSFGDMKMDVNDEGEDVFSFDESPCNFGMFLYDIEHDQCLPWISVDAKHWHLALTYHIRGKIVNPNDLAKQFKAYCDSRRGAPWA